MADRDTVATAVVTVDDSDLELVLAGVSAPVRVAPGTEPGTWQFTARDDVVRAIKMRAASIPLARSLGQA